MKQENSQINKSNIPKYVTRVTETIEKAGFEVFLVGGCVRDLLMDINPKDWDLTTNAKPEQLIPLFEKTIYENKYGTVGICIPIADVTPADGLPVAGRHETDSNVTHETKKDVTRRASIDTMRRDSAESHVPPSPEYHILEVTPYRTEAKYSDFRHPDDVKFSDNIEDDLKRRDFTINALAYNISKGQLIDLYKGQEDIKDKVIRAVGDPDDRFQEDALRMLRAIRFGTRLDFAISYDTMQAISINSELIKNISLERIRDEFTKIVMSDNPISGIGLLEKLGLLQYIIPELQEGIGCEQKGAHIYDVWEHLLHALDHAAKKNWPLEIRLSALFHDIGKPGTRRWDGTKNNGEGKYTFFGHEVIGYRMTKLIMERLKYPKAITEKVLNFTRYHMFFSDTDKITLSAVRRIVQNVGRDNVWDLMKVRECDRVGMKKAEAPHRLRKYHAMIEEVLRDPISVGQLAIDGKYMIEVLHVKPGPRMGWMLSALLEEVLDDPSKNTEEYLSKHVKLMEKLEDKELRELGESGKEKKDKLEEEEVKKLHKKHGV